MKYDGLVAFRILSGVKLRHLQEPCTVFTLALSKSIEFASQLVTSYPPCKLKGCNTIGIEFCADLWENNLKTWFNGFILNLRFRYFIVILVSCSAAIREFVWQGTSSNSNWNEFCDSKTHWKRSLSSLWYNNWNSFYGNFAIFRKFFR